jgi:hypothetical protein
MPTTPSRSQSQTSAMTPVHLPAQRTQAAGDEGRTARVAARRVAAVFAVAIAADEFASF